MKCAVVAALNEERHIKNVLLQLHRGGLDACAVVVGGSSDSTEDIAEANGPRLFTYFQVIRCAQRLGPDVPRAIGVYEAQRIWPQVQSWLFIDGDLGGAFGPILADFIGTADEQGADVTFAGRPPGSMPERLDERLWTAVLTRLKPELALAKPAEVPLLVRARVFRSLPPALLSRPGRWLAACVQNSELHLAAIPFEGKLLGNPTRSARHQACMRDTLVGDALEGVRLLTKQKPSRQLYGRIYDGWHSLRRLDLVAQAAGQLQVLV